MIDIMSSAFPGASVALMAAFNVVCKATMMLAVAYAVHALLGRRRALARSALWDATLIGLILLPLASLAVPRLFVAVLPAPAAASLVSSTEPAGTSKSLQPLVSSDDVAFPEESSLKTVPIALAHSNPTQSTDNSTPTAADPAWGKPIGMSVIVPAIYLSVAVLLAIRLAASLAAVRGLKRRCELVSHPAWLAALDRTRKTLNINSRVALLTSDRVSIPMVFGWLRPVIMLPTGLAATASSELIDMLLLHELAHVRRGDFAWNLMNKLVRLVYWPHPLVWPVDRIIGMVREQACDDLCVAGAGGAALYRASLLEVASGLVGSPEPSVGLAMARATNLSQRLAWIGVSQGKSRCLLSLPARFGMVVAAIGLTGILGSIELERQTLAAEQQKEVGAPEAKPQAAQPLAIEITVVAKDSGKRLPGASVRFSIDFETSIAKADDDGVVRFDLSKRKFRDSLSFDAWAEGYVQQRYFFAQNDARYPKIPTQFTVALLPGEETLGGTVVDEQKRPIAGVQVAIWGYLGEKKDERELTWMVDAVTDEKGDWRCRCFRSIKFAYLYLSHRDYLCDDRSHPRRHGWPSPDLPPQPGDQPLAGLRDFSDVQVMTAGVSLEGKVTGEQDTPIAGAEVGWLENHGQITFHKAMPVTSTNASGRFRFPHVRPGPLLVQVKAKGYAPELKPLDAIDRAGHLTLKLRVPRSLSGRVIDSGGKPVPDAFVNVDTWRGSRALGVFFKSDAEGRFRWDDAPPDGFTMNVSRAGFAGITERRVAPEEKEITVILKRSLTISGWIKDAATGKPIDQTTVEVGVPDPKTGEIAWTREMQLFSFQGRLQGNIDVEKRPELRLRISAIGYEPLVSRVFRGDENQVDYEAKLTRAGKPQGVVVSGVVRRPDGQPLAGATVAITYPMAGQHRLPTVHIENGELQLDERLPTVKTDAQGCYTLAREDDPAGRYFAVIVVHLNFYAEVDRSAIEAGATITAKPWGRVEGMAWVRGKPAAGVSIRYFADRLGNADVPHVYDSGQAQADDRGRFVIERVVPGDVRLARGFGEGSRFRAWSNGELVVVRPGETARAEVGAKGRPVVARVVPPGGFDSTANYTVHSEFEIESDRPNIAYPSELRAKRDGSMVTWAKRWWASDEGHEYRRKWYRHGQAKLQADGTILADDVPPGDYRLTLTYSADPIYGPGRSPDRVAYATKQFTIPKIPDGRSDEPFDLGELRPRPKESLTVGQPAPKFDVETLDGRHVKLEDFRGKILLLDFWATWCGPCVAEIPALKELHEHFGKDERFAMLSLSLDAAKEAPRKFVADKKIAWAQGFLGEWVGGGVPDNYHVEAIPALFLIGPDGTLLSKDMRGEAIEAAVANALRKP